MKQTEARALFPKHKLVFTNGGVQVYDVNDTQKTLVLAEIGTSAVGNGSYLLVRNQKGKLMTFARVRSYSSVTAIRNALTADRRIEGKPPLTEAAAKSAFAKSQQGDVDTCLHILAAHYRRGVPADLLKYLTKPALDMYYPTSSGDEKPTVKKPAAKKPVAKVVAEKPAVKKPVSARTAAVKENWGKPAEKAVADKPAPKKPAAKKPVEQLNPKRLPRIKGQSDLGTISDAISKSRTKAVPVPVPEKWSVADEKIYETVMQDLHHLTLRMNEINTARLKGLSIAEYDKQKAK